MSMIRSPELAPQGQKKIAWAARHMPVLSSLAEKYASRRPFAGLKMALCIHLEAKTAYLARVFQRCGAQRHQRSLEDLAGLQRRLVGAGAAPGQLGPDPLVRPVGELTVGRHLQILAAQPRAAHAV